MPGTLYIVATPIGNLEDITLRALRILKEVDGVVAEDTRRSRVLLSHFGIHKKLISYFEYSKQGKADAIINLLEQGENLALVSDAGTPALSDPGARLSALAYSRGIPIIPVPGPSALLSALSVCGFPTEPLHFWGFLSPSTSKRKKLYHAALEMKGIHCFYVSPHKFLRIWEEWKEFFSDYTFFVAKEITKKFETFWRGTWVELAPSIHESEVRGEYTVLLTRRTWKD